MHCIDAAHRLARQPSLCVPRPQIVSLLQPCFMMRHRHVIDLVSTVLRKLYTCMPLTEPALVAINQGLTDQITKYLSEAVSTASPLTVLEQQQQPQGPAQVRVGAWPAEVVSVLVIASVCLVHAFHHTAHCMRLLCCTLVAERSLMQSAGIGPNPCRAA